jgi:hypothetical protein
MPSIRSVFLSGPFPPSLISPHPFCMCSIVSLSSQHILHLPLLPSNTCFLSPHSESATIFLSLALSLPRYSGISSVVQLSYSLLYLDSLILFLISCLSVLCPFHPVSSAFIHFSFAFSLSTRIPVPLVAILSLLLLLTLFLFSPAFRQYPALFPSIHFVS